MILANENFNKLTASYLFSEIARRVAVFQEANPDKPIIKLGIGDVTLPLATACINAFHEGVDEMAQGATFHGYGPEQGYSFLRELVAKNDYQARGADIQADEIFISDGAKCDTANIQEIFALDTKVAIPDPVYPVYLDTNIMAGRTGIAKDGRYEGITYLETNTANGFVPALPETPVDLIYLCFPNNPTGATITKAQLAEWVAYAKANKALILYDAAYEAFIRNPELPKTIYEIEGARDVAIEFRSFSKTAGFTGTRCAFTVVPKSCMAYTKSGETMSLHTMWNRRHTTKFNGVSYPVQKAAAAIYTAEGQAEVKAQTDYYLKNAAHIVNELTALGYDCAGGIDSPYIWLNGRRDSWEFFDLLLNEAAIVTTPGSGFGKCGQGFIRISAFNDADKVVEAMKRVKKVLG